jgi:hypothetical protein
VRASQMSGVRDDGEGRTRHDLVSHNKARPASRYRRRTWCGIQGSRLTCRSLYAAPSHLACIRRLASVPVLSAIVGRQMTWCGIQSPRLT